MNIEDLYKNARYGSMFTEFKIYAEEQKVEFVIDSVDKTLKSKLLQEGIFLLNIASQDAYVTAVHCKKDDSCVMKVRTAVEGILVGTRYYVVNGNDVRDISKKDYNKLSIPYRDPSNKVVIKDIEYVIKRSEEARNNDEDHYYVDDLDNCIAEIKNNRDFGRKKLFNKIKHWIHKVIAAIYKLKDKFTNNINKIFKKNIVHDSREALLHSDEQQSDLYENISMSEDEDISKSDISDTRDVVSNIEKINNNKDLDKGIN